MNQSIDKSETSLKYSYTTEREQRSQNAFLWNNSDNHPIMNLYQTTLCALQDYIREGVKKQVFYCQADRKCILTPIPPLTVSFLCVFLCFFILDYDYMCSETDFTVCCCSVTKQVKITVKYTFFTLSLIKQLTAISKWRIVMYEE